MWRQWEVGQRFARKKCGIPGKWITVLPVKVWHHWEMSCRVAFEIFRDCELGHCVACINVASLGIA